MMCAIVLYSIQLSELILLSLQLLTVWAKSLNNCSVAYKNTVRSLASVYLDNIATRVRHASRQSPHGRNLRQREHAFQMGFGGGNCRKHHWHREGVQDDQSVDGWYSRYASCSSFPWLSSVTEASLGGHPITRVGPPCTSRTWVTRERLKRISNSNHPTNELYSWKETTRNLLFLSRPRPESVCVCVCVIHRVRSAVYLQPIRVFIAGPPASGKTTITDQLCAHYKLHHIHIKDVIDEIVNKMVNDSRVFPVLAALKARIPEAWLFCSACVQTTALPLVRCYTHSHSS